MARARDEKKLRGALTPRAARLWLLPLLLVSACAGRRSSLVSGERPLGIEEIAARIPTSVRDRQGWAEDVAAALDARKLDRGESSVCAVLAVIEQESGFVADPPVAGLSQLVRTRLTRYARKLGPLGERALAEVLEGKAIGHDLSFHARLSKLRTERDLDLLFRDLLAYHRSLHPKTFAALNLLGDVFSSKRLEDLNPVTTAGSMQVSVRFAQELAERDRSLSAEQVRDELYTRRGGVLYGTARLLEYEAEYSSPLYRFADFNAGPYASRNAAVQEQLSRLTGISLALDGDLLAYGDDGEPKSEDSKTLEAALIFRARFAPQLSERQVRRDL